jgi:hypothetical protein
MIASEKHQRIVSRSSISVILGDPTPPLLLKLLLLVLVIKFCEIAFELGTPWTVGSVETSSIVPGKKTARIRVTAVSTTTVLDKIYQASNTNNTHDKVPQLNISPIRGNNLINSLHGLDVVVGELCPNSQASID